MDGMCRDGAGHRAVFLTHFGRFGRAESILACSAMRLPSLSRISATSQSPAGALGNGTAPPRAAARRSAALTRGAGCGIVPGRRCTA